MIRFFGAKKVPIWMKQQNLDLINSPSPRYFLNACDETGSDITHDGATCTHHCTHSVSILSYYITLHQPALTTAKPTIDNRYLAGGDWKGRNNIINTLYVGGREVADMTDIHTRKGQVIWPHKLC